MALSKTVTTPQGFESIDAYHRVENVSLSGKTHITFFVRSYKTENDPFFKEETFSCVYDINGDNPIAQAYAHLKSLTEFADAIDC